MFLAGLPAAVEVRPIQLRAPWVTHQDATWIRALMVLPVQPDRAHSRCALEHPRGVVGELWSGVLTTFSEPFNRTLPVRSSSVI